MRHCRRTGPTDAAEVTLPLPLSLSLCGKMMMFFVFSFRNHSHFCAKGQTDCTFSLLLLLLPVSHGQKPDKAIRYRLMCDMLRGVHVRLCVCVCVCRQQVVFVCFKIFNYFRVSFVVCLFIKSGKRGVEGVAAGLALTQSLIRSLSDLGLAAAGASQDP